MNKRAKRILRILIMIFIICMLGFIGFGKMRINRYSNSENSFFVASNLVGVTIETHTGSGLIWNIDDEKIVIVSNKHILENGAYASIQLESGNKYEAEVIGVADEYDVGFCFLKKSEVTKDDLKNMTKVSYYLDENKIQQAVSDGVAVLHVGVNTRREGEEAFLLKYDGQLAGYEFIPEFYEMMLISKGDSKPGMSGGAVFNNNGILLGLLTGGYEGMTYSISTVDIEKCANSLIY